MQNLALALAGLALLATAGCGEPKTAAAGRDYTVRGQVRQLPDPANPASGLWLIHEAVDDWAGRDGKVEGMDSMSMPFEVADGVPLTGIDVNDAIEFTLHVDWEAETPVEITRVKELPPGTKLEFREARPPEP
jgi:hypothetical protein